MTPVYAKVKAILKAEPTVKDMGDGIVVFNLHSEPSKESIFDLMAQLTPRQLKQLALLKRSVTEVESIVSAASRQEPYIPLKDMTEDQRIRHIREMETAISAIADKHKEAIDNAHYNIMALNEAKVVVEHGKLVCERVKFEQNNDKKK